MRTWLPTDAWVRWLLVPAVAFIALAGNTSHLADYWHHLARGRAIFETGQLLDRDIFTCTVPGRSFQDVNWLSQVIYFQLDRAGGLALVRIANALLVAATLAWLMALCRRVSGSLPTALGIGVVAFLGLWDVLTIRPQSFSLLLFVVIYDVLDRSERRPMWLLVPPILMALWANLHGAFPAGLMLLGCWWLASIWTALRQSALFGLCLAASALATLVNPYGWDIYYYVGQTSNASVLRGIDEWLPPGLDTLIGWTFFSSLPLLIGLFAYAWQKRGAVPTTAREAVLVACFLPLACNSVRMVAWWLLVIAPMIAARISVLWPKTRLANDQLPNRGAAACVAGLLGVALLSLPGLQRFNPLIMLRAADSTTAEVHEAQAFLTNELGHGRIFSRFEWSEYLTWAAHPHFQVFMDGRIEIYPDEVWQAYAIVTCGNPSWAHVLDEYRIDALLLDANYHRRTGLLDQVERSPHWQRRHHIGNAVVFTRSTTIAQQ